MGGSAGTNDGDVLVLLLMLSPLLRMVWLVDGGFALHVGSFNLCVFMHSMKHCFFACEAFDVFLRPDSVLPVFC